MWWWGFARCETDSIGRCPRDVYGVADGERLSRSGHRGNENLTVGEFDGDAPERAEVDDSRDRGRDPVARLRRQPDDLRPQREFDLASCVGRNGLDERDGGPGDRDAALVGLDGPPDEGTLAHEAC